MIIIINEYILVIHGKGEAFRVYNHNEKLAIQTFISACDKYSDTTNKEYKEHWEQLRNEIRNGNYSIILNNDFLGVRAV
jgi:D-serine dehydratase